MKEIQLTKGKVALVDDEDFDALNVYKWHAHKDKLNWYARRNFWVNGKSKSIRMHQTISGKGSDHKDGNGLNNQRYNLRLASGQQNVRNRAKSTTVGGQPLSSQYKGVSWNKQIKRWVSYIRVDCKSKHLGTFPIDQEVAAAKAYDVAAVHYFGEFARLNFIVDKTSAVV